MNNRKIGFVFAGQGSQYVGMGHDFNEQFDEAKEIYNHISSYSKLKNLCFYGPKEELDNTKYAQPAILLTSLAISSVLLKYDIKAEMVAGLSLGEYSALTYAQTFSLEDALLLVKERGQIMADALSKLDSTMLAILGLDVNTVQNICNEVSSIGVCEIATFSYPGQIVITGNRKALMMAKDLCKINNAKRVVPLNVSGAFHSSLLEEASYQLEELLTTISFHKSSLPVVFNATGMIETENIKDLLVKQIKSPVYFQQSIEHMILNGINCFISIGPGTTLTSYIKKIDPSLEAYSVNNLQDLELLIQHIKV